MDAEITNSTLDKALLRLGQEFAWQHPVTIVIVGGAAAMLKGHLPASQTTGDVDVVLYEPKAAFSEIEHAARMVAREMGLPDDWLNSQTKLFIDEAALPEGWRERCDRYLAEGMLRVLVISRIDLIAMKVFAGRTTDVDHLMAMGPAAVELEHAGRYLDQLEELGGRDKEVKRARELLAELR